MQHKNRAIFALLLGLALLVGAIGPIAVPAAMPGDSRYEQLTLTATGSPGAASGTVTGTERLWGYVKAVHVDYTAGISNTTDITLTTGSPANTIMVKADSLTDTWYYPSVQFSGATGAAVSGAYGRFPIDDYVIVQAAESSTGTITVTVYYGQ